MSSDNCIAILKTKDKFEITSPICKKNTFGKGIIAYRVAHIGAIDNYDWYIENEIHNLGCWFNDLFGKAEVHYDQFAASKQAKELHDEVEYTEYGIIEIDATDYNFPGC